MPALNQKSLKFFKEKTVLEAGCGTAELSTAVALLKARKVIAIDLSFNSLKQGLEYKKKFKLNNLFFIQGNINNLPLNERFDLILSMGVIHHNKHPEKTFESLQSLLKLEGLISIGLYNKYGRLRLRIKNKILDILVGNDKKKRLNLAIKLFFKGRMPNQGINWLADKFIHPLERYFSINDVLKWFKKNNLEFVSSKPEIKGSKFLTQIKWFIKRKGAFFIMTGKKLK